MNRRKNKARRQKSTEPSYFINKLYQMMEDYKIEPVISWTSSGEAINIKNVSRFSEEVLPEYFKHNNYSSFIRQLNMYNFRKVRHSEGENVYMNEYFKNGCYHQLKNICRKIREERDHLQLCRQIKQKKNFSRELNDLEGRQKNLESVCKQYIIQNQKLMEQNQKLIRKMQNDSLEKDRQLEECILMLLANSLSIQLPSASEQLLSIRNGSEENGQSSSQCSPLEAMSRQLDQNEKFKQLKNMVQNIFHKKDEKNQRCADFRNMSPHYNFCEDEPMILEEAISENDYLSFEQFQDVEQIPVKIEDSS